MLGLWHNSNFTYLYCSGSIEELVENLVKTWEAQASHFKDFSQWTTVDHDNYTVQVGNEEELDGRVAYEIGNYNALMKTCPAYKKCRMTTIPIFSKPFIFRRRAQLWTITWLVSWCFNVWLSMGSSQGALWAPTCIVLMAALGHLGRTVSRKYWPRGAAGDVRDV